MSRLTTIEKRHNGLPFISQINFSSCFPRPMFSFWTLIGPLSGPVEKVEGKKAKTDKREKRRFQENVFLRFFGQSWVWLLLLLPSFFACYLLLCWKTFLKIILVMLLPNLTWMYNNKWVGGKGRLFLKLRISEVEVGDAMPKRKYSFSNFWHKILHNNYIIHIHNTHAYLNRFTFVVENNSLK